jgi:hypothetical protein
VVQHNPRAGARRTKTLPTRRSFAHHGSLTLGAERGVLLAGGVVLNGVQDYRMVEDDGQLMMSNIVGYWGSRCSGFSAGSDTLQRRKCSADEGSAAAGKR